MDEAAIYDEALKADRDRAFCSLFLPVASRQTAIALLLFNAELARIPSIVQDPAAGLFRFQFWRDAILGDKTSPSPSGHYASHAWVGILRKAITQANLKPEEIEALIEARTTLLDGWAGQDLSAIEAFIEATAGHLQGLIASLVSDDEALISRARHAGTAYGLAGLWPALATQVTSGSLQLPDPVLRDIGWRQGARIDASLDQRLAETTRPLLDRAGVCAGLAVQGRSSPRAFFGVLAVGRIASWQIARQKLQPASVLAAAASTNPPWVAPALALRRLLNRP